jgi:hypothetical protein
MSELSVPQRIARPNAWWGMALFIATEATLFGLIFGSYFYIRFQHAQWPPPGFPKPETADTVASMVPRAVDPAWFEERFTGPELDPGSWLPYYLPVGIDVAQPHEYAVEWDREYARAIVERIVQRSQEGRIDLSRRPAGTGDKASASTPMRSGSASPVREAFRVSGPMEAKQKEP